MFHTRTSEMTSNIASQHVGQNGLTAPFVDEHFPCSSSLYNTLVFKAELLISSIEIKQSERPWN